MSTTRQTDITFHCIVGLSSCTAQALVVADVSEPGASCFDSAQFVTSSLGPHGAGLMVPLGCR